MYQVIIAEDELFVRLGIKNGVDWKKYHMQVVYDAANGTDAWEKIQEVRPDILITDLMMPGMDGQQLIESVRQSGMEPYIIVITCLEEFKTIQKMMSLGVRDYLLKATMTEQEIQTCLEKAEKFLNKQAKEQISASVSRELSPNEKLSRIIPAFLSDLSLLEKTKQELAHANIPTEGPFVIALGLIESVFQNTASQDTENICMNLIDLAGYQQISGCRLLPVRLDQQSFLLIMLPEQKTEKSILNSLKDFQENFQDLLNIQFSLLIDRCEDFAQIPRCYRHLLTARERHYLDGCGTVVPCWEGRQQINVQEICAPLSEYEGWFGRNFGPAAAAHFQDCLTGLIQNAEKTREEMLYALLHLTHVAGGYFDESLKKEQKQCEWGIMHTPFLPEGIATLSIFLQSCKQHLLLHGTAQVRSEIRAALEIIHQNLVNPELSLGFVAEQVGLSETYFSTLFHTELNQTFSKYLTNTRIEQAKYLLENTDGKIWDIAVQTGFSDDAYFSKVFKKTTGLSPKDWRNLWK